MLAPIYLDKREILHDKFGQNIKIVCIKYMASSEAMTSSTHIHIDVLEMFRENSQNFKVS